MKYFVAGGRENVFVFSWEDLATTQSVSSVKLMMSWLLGIGSAESEI